MAGVSTESRAAIVELFDRRFAADASVTVSNELFALAALLDTNGAVRRSLTDPSREAEQRRGIAAALLEGKVFPAVRELAASAASSRWSDERDLADVIEHLAVLSAAGAAQLRGGPAAVQAMIEDLLRFGKFVESDARVQTALTDARATVEAKQKLAASIVRIQTPEAKALINQAIEHPRGLTPAKAVHSFAQTLVARNKRSIAVITVSSPLDASRSERLERALSSLYGRDLTLDITVDPEVLGGMKVQVGDEVIDGTMTAKISDLNRTVAAS